jgi:hypothetical protein
MQDRPKGVGTRSVDLAPLGFPARQVGSAGPRVARGVTGSGDDIGAL